MKFSKFFAPVIALITILAITLPPLPTKAVATLAVVSVPTLDVAAVVQRTVKWSLDKALSVALAVIKRVIIGQMVDQTVEWIQGNGKPKFVTDWKGLLEDAGQAAAGEFAKEVGLGFLCEPFSAQVQISLFPVKKFSKRAECTLDKIVSNINNFREDFRNGGWIAYSTSWQPQNNIFGATLMTTAELERRTSAASGASWSEASASGGYLSIKDCEKDKDGKDIESTCKTTTPGNLVGEAAAKAVGADFDLIINANDIKDILASITNALINRLIKEGTKGLTGVNPPADPDAGYVDLGADPCQKLTGMALKTCQEYRLAAGRDAEFSQSGFIQQIDLTLQPNIAIKETIVDSIDTLQTYIKWAKLAYNTLSNLQYVSICKGSFGREEIGRTELMANIDGSIKQEESLLDRLKTDQINNQTLIDQLQSARNQINALSAETEEMLSIFDAIAGKLDAAAAETFKSTLSAENTEIDNRVQTNLNQFDKQVKSCQTSR